MRLRDGNWGRRLVRWPGGMCAGSRNGIRRQGGGRGWGIRGVIRQTPHEIKVTRKGRQQRTSRHAEGERG